MEKYANNGGDSGVIGYENGEDSITVQFERGKDRYYLYNYSIPGMVHVENMKELAKSGRGLNSYISKIVKSNYAKKW